MEVAGAGRACRIPSDVATTFGRRTGTRSAQGDTMTFKQDLIAAKDEIVGSNFETRDGQVVPTTADVGYHQAVKLHATYLYVDLVDSSGLVAICPKETVGKVLRLFLDLNVRIIRKRGGHIRSFDGDRVMGIFIGAGRQDAAVQAAMQIRWACKEIIQPEIKSRYTSIKNAEWVITPGSGIASGQTFIVRGGVRKSSSDLVSVGNIPNLAAKLSDERAAPYHVRIGKGTYSELGDNAKISKGVNMWDGPYTMKMGGKDYSYYRSSYNWSID
jgi:adenylate cyclase